MKLRFPTRETALLVCTSAILCAQAAKPYTSWADYGGSADDAQYSALNQIDRSNVNRRTLAWTFPVPGSSGRFGFNPVVVDGSMYVLGPNNAIVALDAATGRQLWSHPVDGRPTDRGINYWQSKDGDDRRLIFAAGSFLQEINARTGVTSPAQTVRSRGDDQEDR
jgi:quinoprotein glucose dehydrogenase